MQLFLATLAVLAAACVATWLLLPARWQLQLLQALERASRENSHWQGLNRWAVRRATSLASNSGCSSCSAADKRPH